MIDRTFDYRPRHDERSRNYGVAAATDLAGKSRFWVPGTVVTDQGSEGACVGHGVVNEAMASPVRVKDAGMGAYASIANRVAYEVYKRAQDLDPWQGNDYDGTSVLAGMKVGQERGWWSGYRWAFSMNDLRAALELGPVVIGVEWYDGMYEAPGGDVDVRGNVVGGHCLLLTGYTPRRRSFANRPAYRWRNSWGGGPNGYGVNGSAYIRATDLDRILFRAGGEAAVPVNRSL